jgi:hypothetical protein
MSSPQEAVDEALVEVTKARKRVNRGTSKQVTKKDEIDYLKAVSYAWFKSHRPILTRHATPASLQSIDGFYQRVLDSTTKNAARKTYVDTLDEAKTGLASLRGEVLITEKATSATDASPPDFSSLVGDAVMKEILTDRWRECQKCLEAGAYLAATVMMGGLLEALFVARANQLSDKSILFKAKATPQDTKTKKPLSLTQWTLSPYIDVGFEIGWITRSGKDVAAVLRDYRNYVHPEKQRSHGVKLLEPDALMFWDVTRNLTVQLLEIKHAKKNDSEATRPSS